jgi:hypothetical protein
MKKSKILLIQALLICLMICFCGQSFSTKIESNDSKEDEQSFYRTDKCNVELNSFVVIYQEADNSIEAVLYRANSNNCPVKVCRIFLDIPGNIFKSYYVFTKSGIVEMVGSEKNKLEKNESRALFYRRDIFSTNVQTGSGYAFYKWNSSDIREPSFYPTGKQYETFITDLCLDKFNGIVNVYNIWYLGNNFFGNISSKKFGDIPLNPALSPNGALLSIVIADKSNIGFYIISNDRKLHDDDVRWKYFIPKLKNHKANVFSDFLWQNFSSETKRNIESMKYGEAPDKRAREAIINDINRILPKEEFRIIELRKYHTYKDMESFHIQYFDQFIDVIPLQTSSYPLHIPNFITMNRLFLEYKYPYSIRKSSIPQKIVSSYPIYYQEKGKGVRIPHKVWSPDGSSILFTGALEKAYCANVYVVDVKTRKITKILDVNDSSGSFNPDLEWTKNGMVITSESGIFLRDVKLTGGSPGVILKLQLPDSISGMRYGKISPDGKQLFFLGKKDNQVYVFIYNFEDKSLMEEKAGTGNDVSQYCGAWINPDKDTIIKNELEYQEFRGYEDLR